MTGPSSEKEEPESHTAAVQLLGLIHNQSPPLDYYLHSAPRRLCGTSKIVLFLLVSSGVL